MEWLKFHLFVNNKKLKNILMKMSDSLFEISGQLIDWADMNTV